MTDKEQKREYQARWYQKHRQEHILRTANRRRLYKTQVRDFLIEYLSGHPCSTCGEKDMVVLEFDHLGKKKDNISTLIQQGDPLDVIKKEIVRCQVLCANCHRRKTALTQNWLKRV